MWIRQVKWDILHARRHVEDALGKTGSSTVTPGAGVCGTVVQDAFPHLVAVTTDTINRHVFHVVKWKGSENINREEIETEVKLWMNKKYCCEWMEKREEGISGREIESERKSKQTNRANSMAFIRFEVFTAVTMTIAMFWDVTRCGSCKNRRFGGT
jgi:hypothetical protein